ncbi:MAG: hypothetical protein JNK20_04620 [Flavipsychrobacter sp.]|jgi:predicted ATPase with chaperone activity|nr:hypothetical protein [Flavipsychrobacter sp.]
MTREQIIEGLKVLDHIQEVRDHLSDAGLDSSDIFMPVMRFIENLVLGQFKDHPPSEDIRTKIIN